VGLGKVPDRLFNRRRTTSFRNHHKKAVNGQAIVSHRLILGNLRL
jgi:hypothetical protein